MLWWCRVVHYFLRGDCWEEIGKIKFDNSLLFFKLKLDFDLFFELN